MSDWKEVCLSDICDSFVNGGTPSTNISEYWKGNIPWVTGADFGNNCLSNIRRRITNKAVAQSSTNIISEGNILLVTRTGVGKIAIAPFDVAISQDITGLYFNAEEANTKFMFYCLQKSLESLKSLNQGTSINGILRDDLITLKINQPSLPEQEKIAEILCTVDDEIERTEALIAKYEMIKQGMMQDLFTRGVDANGKLRPRYEDAPHLYNESPLGMIPKEWEAKRLSELYDCPSRNGLYKQKEFYGYGYPMVHMPQMFRGLTVDISDAVHVSVDNSEINRFGLQKGDLLFARRSLTLEGAGQCTVVDTINEITTFESSIIRVRVNAESSNPFFINQFLNTEKGYLVRLPFIRQVAVSGVSSEDVARFIIPCPQKMEQDAIIAMIKQYAVLIKNEKNQKLKLIKIKQGLMQDLLSGEVRVAV